MALTVRPASAADARVVGNLARQFAGYLRSLGDTTDFKLSAESYLRDGFGPKPAFAGLVAEVDDNVIGYLLYHFGYDSDRAARNLNIVDLYVDVESRKRGVGLALMTEAARIAHEAGAQELVWAVYHANALATAFYKGLGAQRITDLFFMKLRSDCL
ncbi:MAG TPA: GNAT family N-acetyltransferase [Verrucomicrobiae bacterium]|nr:GNAT family N-acetyltransferase [Verrucomicrobiae bacterium]